MKGTEVTLLWGRDMRGENSAVPMLGPPVNRDIPVTDLPRLRGQSGFCRERVSSGLDRSFRGAFGQTVETGVS